MKDLLIKLRRQLAAMIEEIDNYNIPSDDTIFIKKEDLKWIKYLGKLNSYINVFEYKQEVIFTLRVSSSYPYDYEIYNKLMDGTLEILILNKREEEYVDSGHLINYTLEDKKNTILRDLYN
ncbi:hypothetical protein [Flavobacterium sp. GNP001]